MRVVSSCPGNPTAGSAEARRRGFGNLFGAASPEKKLLCAIVERLEDRTLLSDFSSAITPTTTTYGATLPYTITITNGGPDLMGSIDIGVPSNMAVPGPIMVTATNSMGMAQSWTAGELNASTIEASSTSTANIDANGTVAISFAATATSVGTTGTAVWAPSAFGGTDFMTDPLNLVGSQPTVTVNPEPLTVTAMANTKVYDSTPSTAAVPMITSGALQFNTDVANFIETYNTSNAGTGETLTPSGSVNDGNGGMNYAVTFDSVSTGVITALPITVTAVQNTKTYDGTTSAATAPTITMGGLVPGQTSSFIETYDTKDVGTGKTLTPSGMVNDGNNGNNYAVTFDSVSTGVITARPHHGDGGPEHQGLRRHHQRCRRPDDHPQPPPEWRHGELHRDLRHPGRGHGQDAHPVRVGERRQRRQRL